MSSLPTPTPEALAHSARLLELIRARIAAAGGWLPFSRYMELALYAPGLGYYASGTAKLGAAGDFITAPEMTPLFGRALARQVAEVLAVTAGDVLELGAGSGRLALDLLRELAALGQLPDRYLILEVSPDLRERQRALLQDEAPELLPRVAWLDALPETLNGVVLGNEVLDALPVEVLYRGPTGAHARGVAWNGGLAWEDRPLAEGPLWALASTLPETGGYLTEVCPAASALITSLGERLRRGMLLFLDYGFPASEYYHPQRHMGTLKVHYRHHSLDDPFFLPGLADITAHVDFSAVAQAGADAGLELLGYTSQGNFLLNVGLLDLLSELQPGTRDYLSAAAALQKLVQPSEMGELFKVIALGRGLVHPPSGFDRGDRSGAL
ncbi:MAG: SAM-dependent methyltransferase [Pseudomonadota bacterium]|nr:SAM-dependent methyltransferase [Pseudomonadota bacterium]MDP1906465.1 SAM-dependent methyltransferase [Pseudomonadota bacterium]MDP2353937.1 SAM-dependent methyltransferase [Pseudomonadota bacterium]